MPALDAYTYLLELVHSLCEQRKVPSVVADLIAGYLDKRDLFTISILSRKLNDQANSVIYYDVVLDFTKAIRSGRKAILLFRTLLASKIAANEI